MRTPGAHAVLASAVLLTPLVTDPGALHAATSARWAFLTLSASAAVFVVARRRGDLPRRVTLAWLAVLATTALSTAVAWDPITALLGASSRRAGLLLIAVLAVVFSLGTTLPRRAARTVTVIAAVASLVVALWTLGGLVVAGGPVDAPVGNAGQLAGYLLALAGLAWWGQGLVGRQRTVARVCGTVAALAVFATGSQAGVLGLLAGIAVALMVDRQLSNWMKVAALSVAVLLVLAPAVLLPGLFRGTATSIAGRLDVWSVSLDVIRSRPWLGWGPEGFRHGFAAEAPVEFVTTYGDDLFQDRAHQLLLDHVAATGVLGGIALAVLVALVARHVLRGGTGTLPGLVAVGVWSLGWFPSFDVGAVFVLFAGLAHGAVEAMSDGGAVQHRGKVTTVLVGGVAVLCVAASVAATTAYLQDRSLAASLRGGGGSLGAVESAVGTATGLWDGGPYPASVVVSALPPSLPQDAARRLIKMFDAGVVDWQRDAELAIVRGDLSLRGRLLDVAEESYEVASHRSPSGGLPLRGLGRVALLSGDLERAAVMLVEAASRRPADVGVRADLARLSLLQGEMQEAAAWLEEACRVDSVVDPQLERLVSEIETGGGTVVCEPGGR